MEILGRILLGMGAGLLFGVVPLVLGFLLGKNTGGIIGIFICSVCGGLFGFLDKSYILTVIVMVIVVLFIVTDKSRPVSAKSAQRAQADSDADAGDGDVGNTDETVFDGNDAVDGVNEIHADKEK